MKRFWWISLVATITLAAILFLPIPQPSYDDGGTKEYIALTYKIVDWHRIYDDGIYENICTYTGDDRRKSIDKLWETEQYNAIRSFRAIVLEIHDQTVLVEPLENETERQSSDRISFTTAQPDPLDIDIGSYIKVTYSGPIGESYPSQIQTVAWELLDDFRSTAYTDPWLDNYAAKRFDDLTDDHLKITRIYSNCFFAQPVTPLPYTYKINGTLSDDWCVGDQIFCTYENAYCDETTDRIEADLIHIEISDWEAEPGVAYKPVIYLYPEKETNITVKLKLEGDLTCTYPVYDNGWTITASPDGTLTDTGGQTYNYLYWEGETSAQYDFSEGFCIKGADTAAFLEDALAALGLTRREANEFIVYWLPLMEQHPYNIISFQTDRYTDAAQLDVSPSPDTLIRVFMAWKPTDTAVSLPTQILKTPVREGFTVVEWGGTIVNNP